MIHKDAKWIWINDAPRPNEFAYFKEQFCYEGGQAVLSLCAETDYILYVNGVRVAFGQFAGFPGEKYYDTIDITPFLHSGENRLRLTVRYEGLNSATHIDDGAGVIYSLAVQGETVLCSSEQTECGYEGGYVQGQPRVITSQIGYATDLCCSAPTPSKSVLQAKNCRLCPRPVDKTDLLTPVYGEAVAQGIYDLGRETAGYLFVKLRAASAATVKVVYGQHLTDGQVRYLIGPRDFSFEIHTECGEREFEILFVRVSARFLQTFVPEGVEVLSIGVIPALYPQREREFCLADETEQRIYDVSVRTLRLCMNMHYEDTPWREQGLYVMDSRNQMLCGYYAFEDAAFQRANLIFMTRGVRSDGLLELTFPAVNTPSIPFFSLMYPVAVYEYVEHTEDKSILSETMPTMRRIMKIFRSKIGENGCIPSFPAPYWNFYEWSRGCADAIPRAGRQVPFAYDHLILSCAYVYAAERFEKLCTMAGTDFESQKESVKRGIVQHFYEEHTGLFRLRSDEPELYSQLGHAFALLIGLGDERTVAAVKNDTALIPATLSMLPFVYDVLLMRGEKDYVLGDIRAKYGYMLERGATSFWETIEGADDFNKAGSLCHGWSAIPVYYYHRLRGK